MAAPRMFQAIDTFVAEMADGSALHVAKGAVFHGAHELVKRDKGGLLFQPLEATAAEEPPKSTPEAEAAPVEAAPAAAGEA